MKVFFAGATRVEDGYDALQQAVTNRLISYHYQTKSLDEYYYETARDKYANLVLDSGAFSAWSQGVNIDLEAYADYSLKWEDKVDIIVNLDVIPAEPGTKRIPTAEIERSASKGYENYAYLLSRGLPKEKIVHVFHQNEDFKWLKQMVADGMEYIGLSPANDRTANEKITWLADCMPYVTDSTGKPIVKFHGFAVTSFRIMRLFPWYSVDSSTWAVAGGRGGIMIPNTTRGKWDYRKEPFKLILSQISGKKDHFDFQAKDVKKRIMQFLEELELPYGKSDYKLVHKEDKLEENERPCSGSFVINMGFEPPDENHRWIEIVLESGVSNYWKHRQYLNAHFINKYVDQINEDGVTERFTANVDKGFGC